MIVLQVAANENAVITILCQLEVKLGDTLRTSFSPINLDRWWAWRSSGNSSYNALNLSVRHAMSDGADKRLMNAKYGGIWAKPDELRREFWNKDITERRAKLLPFLCGVVAKQDRIWGNRKKDSVARVTNGKAFSYPGYNKMLTGYPDSRIDNNEFGPNPNVTVFEWLNQFPEFRNRIAVYATWKVFADIFNQNRSGLTMQVGWEPPEKGNLTPRQELLNELYRTTTRLDDDDVYDSFLQVPLLEYVQTHEPRVLFVGYGETDNWAHLGHYDLVLQSAHRFDYFVQQLWNTMQSIPAYRDQTTFIVTTDHGRGSGLVDWKEHGVEQKGSDNIWIAVLGPDTEPLGERVNVSPVSKDARLSSGQQHRKRDDRG